ncbi:ribbon-helix-helix domain-containing protein [Vulgatibacter sp.]|uniref:ribbon-helix-helix domain-containing protein n=1 Tax=Vulgatibacter sp. TaxID=1971226 RepID=UPI003567D5EE
MSLDTSDSQRLTSMLIRLPPPLADALRDLSRQTRVRQSEYLREAVRDLLAKYGQEDGEQLQRRAS